MGDTWVTDMTHYLDEEGLLPETLPGPALNVAPLLGSIVGWVTSHPQGTYEETNVPCLRTPGRRRCLGSIFARIDVTQAAITWECLICEDNGYIRGWESTLWDRRNG